MVVTHSHRLNTKKTESFAWLTLLLSMIPSYAFAVEAAETQLLPMGLKVMAALVVVLGLVLLIYAGLKKSGRWIRSGKDSAIQLIEVRYLAPKKALYLIEVNGSKLLLSGTAGRLEAVAQWEVSDGTAGVEPALAPCFGAELQQQINEHQGGNPQ